MLHRDVYIRNLSGSLRTGRRRWKTAKLIGILLLGRELRFTSAKHDCPATTGLICKGIVDMTRAFGTNGLKAGVSCL